MEQFQARRMQIMQALSADDVLLVAAGPLQVRNHDVHYRYRPESNLLYLTNWLEPNAALVLTQTNAWFFCQEPDPLTTVWQGPNIGPKAAQKLLSMPCAKIETLFTFLQNTFGGAAHKFWCTGTVPSAVAGYNWQQYPALSQRAVKIEPELTKIKQAIAASIAGHKAIMQAMLPGVTESALYGVWRQAMGEHALLDEAYPAIIAAGANACILHYQTLNGTCQDSELLLVDAGMEVAGYAADLTRTLPINGKFTAKQAAVYNAVLAIQEAAVNFVKIGTSFAELNAYVDTLYATALQELGVQGELRTYAPHGIGHSLGLDVHDVGLERTQAIPEGAVITIEPGLYFRDTEYAGIGVRIEDNYLMTASGLVCLSTDLPKSLAQIEELCA